MAEIPIKLIIRKKVIHYGIEDKEAKVVSICDNLCTVDDSVWMGTSDKITCKKCLKKINKDGAEW